MAGTNDVRDKIILETDLDDKAGPKLEDLRERLDRTTKSAAAAAEALKGAGVGAGGAATNATSAGAAWERVARRQDEVTAATYKLTAAQEELVRVNALAAKAIGNGANQEQVARVLEKLAANVDRLKISLQAMREAQEGSAQAAQLWKAGLESGDELLTMMASSAKLTADAFVKGSAEATLYGQSLDSLRARFDSVFATTKAYESELALLTRAFELGAIKGPVAQARALDELNAKYATTTGTTKALTAAQEAAAAAAQKQADAWKILGDSIAKMNSQNEANRASYDAVFRVSKEYEGQLKKMDADLAARRINDAQYNVLLDKLNASMANAGRSSQALATGHGQAAFATRQLGVQTVQFFSSLESGIPLMTALVEQGHQIVDVALATGTGFEVFKNAAKAAFGAIASPVGVAITSIALLTAGLAAMVYATENSQKALLNMQQQLRATRTDYSALATDVNQAAKNVASSSPISRADARSAGQIIASAPSFEGSQKDIEALIKLSGDLAVVWGVTVPEAAKTLAAAMDEPSKVAQDLAKKHFPGMDQELAHTIERLENTGHAADAYAKVLEVLKTVQGATTDAMTPFEAAMARLEDHFKSTKEAANNYTAPQGPLARMGTSLADAANDLLNKAERLGSTRGGTNQPMTPLEMYGGVPSQAPSFGPDSFTSGPGEGIATRFRAAGGDASLLEDEAHKAAKAVDDFNKVMDKAVIAVANSPFGKLDAAKDNVEALTNAIAEMGDADEAHAGKLATLTAALALAQKAMREAEDAAKSVTDRQVEASAATAKGNNDIAASYAQGNDAIVQATAYAKAYSDALAQHLTPGTAEFNDTVVRLTVSNVDLARSIGAIKAAEDSRSIENQIELTNAETAAIINNTAANREAVIAIRQKQFAQKDINASPEVQQANADLFARQQASAAYNKAAQELQTVRGNDKPSQIAELQRKIGDFQAQRANPALPTDQYIEFGKGIDAANREIDKLNKTTATHVSALVKQTDTVRAEIEANNDLAKAYAQGGDAVVDITAKLQAQKKLISDSILPTNKDYATKLAALTAEFKELGRSAAELKAVQETKDIDQQIKMLKLESDTLLENNNVRVLTIQHKKDEYEVEKNNASLAPERRAQILAEKDAQAALTQELDNKKQTLSYLQGQFSSAFDTIGNSITDAFVKGSGSAVKWGNVMQGVLTQVVQQFAKLAIINPIMNSLFGGNNPTFGSVMNLFSGGGGGGGGGAATQLVRVGGQLQVLGGGGGGGFGGFGGRSDLTTGDLAAAGVPGFGGGLGLIGTQYTGVGSVLGGGGAFGALGALYASGLGQGTYGTGGTGGGGASGGGLSNLMSIGGSLSSIGKAFFPNTFGTGSGSLFGNIGQSLGLTGQGGALSSITSFLNTPLYSSVGGFFPTFASSGVSAGESAFLGSAGISGPTAGVAGASTATIGSFIGGVGAGYGVGSLAGGYIQGALGKVGPAPQIGAATGAIAGAVIGSVVPVIGTLIGGLVGGLIGGAGGGLIGPKAPSAFSSTMVRINNGFIDVGGTTAQRVDASGERSDTLNAAASLNALLGIRNLRVTSLAGGYDAPYFQVGQNTPGGFQDPSKFSSFQANFANLRFRSDDDLTNRFIQGRAFQNQDELGGVTTSLVDFENALRGTKAETDTTGIALRALSGAANTEVHDRLQEASTFITATYPTLVKGNVGSLQTAQEQVVAQYGPALAEARKFGFGEGDLQAAADRLMAKNTKQATDATDQMAENVMSRFYNARAAVTGTAQDAVQAQLYSFDVQAKQQRQQISDNLKSIWGDAYETTQGYADRMAQVDQASAEERLAILVQYNKKQYDLMIASNLQLLSLQSRAGTSAAALSGDRGWIQYEQINALNRSQFTETTQYNQAEQQQFGDQYAQGADANYWSKLSLLQQSQSNEMNLLAKQIQRSNLEVAISSQQQDWGFSTRQWNAENALYWPTDSGAAMAAKNVQNATEQQNLYLSLTQIYGDAYASTVDYANKMAALQKAQNEETLVLQQQLAQRQTQIANANMQMWRGLSVRQVNADAAGTGNPFSAQWAASYALQNQQASEMDDFKLGLRQTYGDAYQNTQEYWVKVAALVDTQTKETAALAKDQARQSEQLSINYWSQAYGFFNRAEAASGLSGGGSIAYTQQAQRNALARQQQTEARQLGPSLVALGYNPGDYWYKYQIDLQKQAQAAESAALERQITLANRQTAISSTAQDAGFSTRYLTAYGTVTGTLADTHKAQLSGLDAQAQTEMDTLKLTLQQTYGDAYTTSKEYGDKVNALAKAQGEERLALEKQQADQIRQAQEQIANQNIALYGRYVKDLGDLAGTLAERQSSQRLALTYTQRGEAANLSQSLVAAGHPATSAEYQQLMNLLVLAQKAEVDLLNKQIARTNLENSYASQQQNASFATRYQTAAAQVSGSAKAQQAAALAAFDAQALAERRSLYLSLTATYGDSYALTKEYADKLSALQKAQGEERLALQKQQDDQLKSQATQSISSLNQYALGLQTSDKSPLSPQAQLSLTKRQFDTQADLAAKGNYGAVQTLQSYSEAYLSAAHNVYGSGMDYVQAFGRVITALASVAAQTPDALTASILQNETRNQTQILVEQLTALKEEVKQLRLQVAQGQSAPARVAAT
jgi:hypothetical protein